MLAHLKYRIRRDSAVTTPVSVTGGQVTVASQPSPQSEPGGLTKRLYRTVPYYQPPYYPSSYQTNSVKADTASGRIVFHYKLLEDTCTLLLLPYRVRVASRSLYNQAWSQLDMAKARNRPSLKAVVGATVHAACHLCSYSAPLKDICYLLQISPAEVTGCYHLLVNCSSVSLLQAGQPVRWGSQQVQVARDLVILD